jgi:hypothetical protein
MREEEETVQQKSTNLFPELFHRSESDNAENHRKKTMAFAGFLRITNYPSSKSYNAESQQHRK